MIEPAHKAAVAAELARLRPEIEALFADLWQHPELPAMEFRTAGVLATWLTGHGFTVSRAPGGIPTAFIARKRLSDGPCIGILAEYDALPGLANEAVARRAPVSRLRAGHACGHNHIGPANCGAAILLAEAAGQLGLAGEIVVVGTPAEEIVWGKVALLTQGVFDGLDVILTSHGDYQNGAISRPCQSVLSGEIVFSGEAGHGGKPGVRNALEAAEAFVGEATTLREAEFPDVALRHVIRVGGIMPSITPDEARVWLTSRNVSFERARDFYDRLVALAADVARRSHVSQRHQPIAGTRGYLANDVLGRTLFAALETVGLPEWTSEETAFMAELSRAVNPNAGLRLDRGLKLYDTGEDYYGQDDGEVSWRVPLGRVNWAYPEDVTIHHWAWTAWSGHPGSGKGALMATQALALGGLALLANPLLVAEAKTELSRRTEGLHITAPMVGAWRTLTTEPERFWDATWVE
ncbi:MAG: amidohydrolase [Hyphomicrobiaceae bacterium]